MMESFYVLGDEDRKKFARLAAQAWTDDTISERYGREPHQLLAEYGISYPADVETPPLPAKPEGDFSVEELELAAGVAGTAGSASSVSTVGGCAFTACCAGTYGGSAA
jgi:hypothetical protein